MPLSQDFLFQIRNQIPIADLIANSLHLPCKVSEGYLRFLCPFCNEFRTATNPKTNLARCFLCQKNFNPIDIVMTVHQCSFMDALKYLNPLLEQSKKTLHTKPHPSKFS